MPLQSTDLFVVNRSNVDYKYPYSELLTDLETGLTPPNDGKIDVKAGAGLEGTGTGEFTANQADDRSQTFSVKVGGGIIIDGEGNVSIDPNFNLDGNITPPGDGAITIGAGPGIEVTGDTATANQSEATITGIAVKVGDGIIIGPDGGIIIDPDFNLDGNITPPGDGQISYNAGPGLAEVGDDATANQTGNTAKEFSVLVGDGIIIDGNGNIIIDPDFNLDGNITPPGDGKLTINNHDGTLAGDFTANQTADEIITLPKGFSGDYNDLENLPVIGDGKVSIKDFNGSDVGDFTVNQEGDVTITLPEVQIPDALHPKGFINVADPAPADPTHGDLYIQYTAGNGAVTADPSFHPGITGELEEGVFVLYGVDDLWHAGGDALNTQIQSDWNENDVTDPAYIKNKPDVEQLIKDWGAANVHDGTLTINNADGTLAGNFTANQAADEIITLPAGFSGDYDDLTNKPCVYECNKYIQSLPSLS